MRLYIITGTNKGLGKAFAEKILENKDSFVLSVGRSVSESQKQLVNNLQSRFYFIEVDLNELVNLTDKLHSKLELLVAAEKIIFISNAGTITPIGSVGSLSETEIMQSINTNVTAPALICNYLMNHAAGKKIDFINISTGAAEKPIEGWALYCSGKAFAKMFFNIVKEQSKNNPNIRVFSINPGVIDTEMQQKIRNSDIQSFPRHKEFISLKQENKLQSAEQVAARILSEINT